MDEECGEIYLNYLMDNDKRVGIKLSEMKRWMEVVGGIVDVDVNEYLKDF
ncbi:swarming motility protein SwrAA [Bacillus altitudinis]|nr:swarming motility protein SwrAA [Bacillus altitudinis]